MNHTSIHGHNINFGASQPRKNSIRTHQIHRSAFSRHNTQSLRLQSMSNESLDRYITSNEEKQSLVDDAIAWCSQHGLVYGAGLSDIPTAIVHAPFSLLPVAYPRQTFLKAKEAALAFNTMIDAVSRDDEYLRRVLTPASRYDDFTAKLLQIHEMTADARAKRKGRDLSLAINRSDYMLHSPTGSLLQVELNTIASSFGCLSTLVGRLHRYIIGRMNTDVIPANTIDQLPFNNAMDEIADALAAATHAHGAENGVVVMVVQPGERNAYDQQWLQLSLWERHSIRTVRHTLHDISTRGRINEAGQLIIDNRIASVVYFRAGYTPDDYPSDTEWNARVLIEQSNAVSCPSVALQLAGAKKVQQDLANAGVVEKYAATPEDALLMREFFAGLWGLDDLQHDEHAAKAVQDAIQHPGDYVLKPQREGGGNNVYGDALKMKLEQGKDLGDLILMQRIRPPVNVSTMVRLGKASQVETLSELGVYATFLRRGDEVLLNREAGHLVRTKAATSDEGGVAAGFAVLDSPYLVE